MNSKSTKKKLTGSIWALVVCFILLLGTTFAWFTDTASTNVNTIQAGNLDVALEMWDGEKWVSAEGETLNFERAQIEFQGGEVAPNGDAALNEDEILWEPGCTYNLPKLRVKNNGNLALKYKVEVAAVSGDEKLAEVIDVLFIEERQGEDGAAAVSANETVPGMQSVGTLAELLDSTDEDGIAYGKLTAGASTGVINVSLHMQETAGNEYQGKAIDGIQVTVLATQDTVEFDSNDNQYDANAEYAQHVSSIDDLLAALKAGKKNIVLEKNLSYTAPETGTDFPSKGNGVYGSIINVTSDVTLDLNGHNIVVDGGSNSQFGSFAFVDAGGNLTVKGNGTITVKGASDNVAVAAIWVANGGNATVKGGNFINENVVDANGISNEALIYVRDEVSPSDERSTVHVYGGTFKYPKQTGASGESAGNWHNNTSGFNVKNYGYGKIIIHEGVLLSCEEFRQNHDSGVIKLADGCELQKITIDGTEWYKVVKK